MYDILAFIALTQSRLVANWPYHLENTSLS